MSDMWIFECEELRHKLPPEDFSIPVLLPEPSQGRPGLRLSVSAADMPEPFEKYLSLDLACRDRDAKPLIEQQLRRQCAATTSH
jgi:hypothetical protein